MSLVSIIGWIIIGALAGWIASMVMKRDAQMGAVANIVVGILGAVVGGFLLNLIGVVGTTGFSVWSLLVATLGAIVLLFIYGALQRA